MCNYFFQAAGSDEHADEHAGYGVLYRFPDFIFKLINDDFLKIFYQNPSKSCKFRSFLQNSFKNSIHFANPKILNFKKQKRQHADERPDAHDESTDGLDAERR